MPKAHGPRVPHPSSSQFPRGCRGTVPRQPLAAVPVVFSRGCGGSRRPGNGVPGTARPQTALAGSATAGRQVQLARGRSGHSAGGHGGQAAVRHPRTPGFGGTVPPAWAGSREQRDLMYLGGPNRSVPQPPRPTASRPGWLRAGKQPCAAATSPCHVPCHCLAAGAHWGQRRPLRAHAAPRRALPRATPR